VLKGELTRDAVAQRVLDRNADVQPKSGRQEAMENLLNRYV
jgi:xylose isomerase